jgi:hypothetical protein
MGPDGEIEVKGVVLAELEAFEAVNDERFGDLLGAVESLKEQTMASQPFDLVHDCRGSDGEFVCDLTEGGAGEAAEEYGGKQIGLLEPVGRGEGLRREETMAEVEPKALDAMGLCITEMETCLLEVPVSGVVMGSTFGIGAERWPPSMSVRIHGRIERQESEKVHLPKHKVESTQELGVLF